MKLWFVGASLLFSIEVCAVDVTFRLNMNGFNGFGTTEVNGNFNNWCGNCNPMSDIDGDGVWEATIDLSPGSYQYKFSFDNWAGQENLTAESGCVAFDGPFVNRALTVSSAVVLDPVCWGACSDCLPVDTQDWTLFWSDEFNGTNLDTEIWTHEFGNSGWGNNELQTYTSSPQNSSVADGRLTITAREEASGMFTSARIITEGKFEFQYGKVEARIRVPIGQGLWPAFWMLGANFETVGWPHCGEIDIMEHVNNEPLTNSAIHWFNNVGHTYRTNSVPFVKNEFRLYGAIWDEEGVTFTLDDHPFFRFDFDTGNNSEPIFQRPFFFLLNVAVGGNWPGDPDATTPFPAKMEVDYVRVYQQETLSSGETVAADPIRIYPNPVSDVVNVDFGAAEGPWTISVFNALGEKLAEVSGNGNTHSFDMTQWSVGMYLLQIKRDGAEERSYRIIK